MNTYAKEVKSDPRDKITVEIGDAKQPNFYPQLKIKRWTNEVNASFRLLGDTGTHRKVGNKVIYESAKREAHFYDIPVSTEHPEGGHELEVVLKEKPVTNKVEFSMQTKGLEFFYQPELTQKEKNHGAVRPENVVGSYAVYYKNCPANYVGGKLYKTGKAFHIYRPKIIDANGKWTWGELTVTGNKLTVTIPQAFLDSAVYPVIVDPTFGYTTLGGSDYNFDEINGNYSTGAVGTVQKITVGCRYAGSIATKCAMYVHSTGSFIDETEERTDIGDTNAFYDFNFSVDPTISAVDYWLVIWSDTNFFRKYDSETGREYSHDPEPYGTFPDPFTPDIRTGYKFSIYATYTAGGATGIASRRLLVGQGA